MLTSFTTPSVFHCEFLKVCGETALTVILWPLECREWAEFGADVQSQNRSILCGCF
jgi:hypothetical protein